MANGSRICADRAADEFLTPDNPAAACVDRASAQEPGTETPPPIVLPLAAELRREADAGSRGNALKHGLSATTLLPALLGGERFEQIRAELVREYTPRTFTEKLLIAEVARHAAALELIECAEPAVMRQAALTIINLRFTGDDPAGADDAQLAAAVTSEPLERCARYRRGREKSLLAALEKLRSFRAESASAAPAWRASESAAPTALVTGQHEAVVYGAGLMDLQTRAGCEAYLRAWVEPRWRCARCRGVAHWWLASRQTLECRDCGAHVGLRHGLVFDRSHVSLDKWFLAIRIFAARSDITAAELAPLIGVQRLASVRGMLRRMDAACADYDRIDRFAGLIRYPVPLADRDQAHRSNLQNGNTVTSRASQPSKSRRHHPLSRGFPPR